MYNMYTIWATSHHSDMCHDTQVMHHSHLSYIAPLRFIARQLTLICACVTWLVANEHFPYYCGSAQTQSFVRYESIQLCDMTHFYVCHDLTLLVTYHTNNSILSLTCVLHHTRNNTLCLTCHTHNNTLALTCQNTHRYMHAYIHSIHTYIYVYIHV